LSPSSPPSCRRSLGSCLPVPSIVSYSQDIGVAQANSAENNLRALLEQHAMHIAPVVFAAGSENR
jgi:hypothetical protein